MDLTFFTAGGCTRVAVFWICDWTVLITHQCFHYGWTVLVKHQDLFFLCSVIPATKARDRKELGGSRASTATKGILHAITLCSAINAQRKGRRGVTLYMQYLSSQATLVHAETWIPRNWQNIWLLMGSIKALSCTIGE